MPNLIHGAGDTPAEGGCIMQAIAWLDSHGEKWSDAPDCVHPVLRKVAIWVNDSVDTLHRRQLWPLVPRLMGTVSGDRRTDVRTGVALAVWSAERMLPLITDPAKGELAAERVGRARAWLNSQQVGGQLAPNYAGAAYAAAYAADAAADAAYADAAAAAAARIKFLTDLIDEYDRITGRTAPAEIDTILWTELRDALTGSAK
jgi:hypothetical protein